MKKYIMLLLIGSNVLSAFPGWDLIADMMPGWRQGVNFTGKVLGIKKEAHVHLSLSPQERTIALLKLDADTQGALLTKEQKGGLVSLLVQGIMLETKKEPEAAENAQQE